LGRPTSQFQLQRFQEVNGKSWGGSVSRLSKAMVLWRREAMRREGGRSRSWCQWYAFESGPSRSGWSCVSRRPYLMAERGGGWFA